MVDFFVNTEYIDREHSLELISLGVVAADGREFYAVSTEFDQDDANEFVRSTVLPLLEPRDHPAWMSRSEICRRLVQFIGDEAPVFWSWGAVPWDGLAIAQLFPLNERVPDRWRYTGYDVSALAEDLGLGLNPPDPVLPALPADVHHALVDARWVRQA